MRRVKRRPFMWRLRHGERGAVTTIFAVLVAGGVVMGMLALSVDVGSVMFERRQLQNGADATSLALASVCAQTPTAAECTPLSDSVEPLLGANAKDQFSGYDERSDAPEGACGRAVVDESGASLLPPCDSADPALAADITDLTECPPLPDWLADEPTIPFVETYSRTLTGGGSTILPKYFSQLFAGGGPDTTVTACARAAWGPAGSYTGTVPFTFSTCEWDYFMQDYDGYVAEPPGPNGYGDGVGQTPWPHADREKVIYFKADKATGEPKSCMWNDMNDFPGGFGYLTQDNCKAILTDGDWVDANTGAPMPQDCKAEMSKLHNTEIAIPVFDCTQWGKDEPTLPVEDLDCSQPVKGTQVWYHIAGWAKFYLAGYRYPSGSAASHNLGIPCGANEVCISGWFLKGELGDVDSITAPGGDNDFGSYAVLPAG